MTDPFGRSNFVVTWDNASIPGVSSVSALRCTLGEGGREAATDPVELIRARTADRAFERWAETPTAKVVMIALLDPAQQPGLTFLLDECVPVGYVPLDALDASVSGVALERLVIRCRSIRTQPAN